MPLLTKNEITVTDEAREYLERVLNGKPAVALNILSGHGCGGNEYDLKPLDAVPEAGATEFVLQVSDKLAVVVKPTDFMKLFGTCIDFITDTLGNQRIEVRNPNEKGRCGCGLSVEL